MGRVEGAASTKRQRYSSRVDVMNLFRLDGKSALVTGASSGIGKQVALAYAQAGATVAIAARHLEPLQELAAEIAAGGATALAITCDVTQPEQVNAMLNRVTDELGGIDIAVCNAGIIAFESLLDMPLEQFQGIQNTNVNGVFLTAQAAAKAMVALQRAGTIITTASMSGHIINTPAGIEGMFRYAGRDKATPRPDGFEISPARMAEGADKFGQIILGPPR